MLPALQMVAQAFTADTLASAGSIGAVAIIEIFFLTAFHWRIPHSNQLFFPIVCIMIKQFDQNCFNMI